MENQKQKVDYTKLPPELKAKLEAWEKETPGTKQVRLLEDIADMVQEVVNAFDLQSKAGGKSTKDLGVLLMAIRESLDKLNNKEAPKLPDYAKPVVKALQDLEKAFKEALGNLKLDAPEVSVAPPRVDVDLKGVEKILKTDVPKAFKEAIKALPKVDIPKSDYTPLVERMDAITELLESIDTASRLKPQFPVSQLNSMKNSLETVATNSGSSSTIYQKQIDKEVTATNIIYIGRALPGTSQATGAWQIKKIDKTAISITYADAGAFTATWNDRATETYS